MHRFFSNDIRTESSEAVLDEFETRHLRDVLRIREGGTVRVFDGKGSEYECGVSNVAKKQTVLAIRNEVDPAAPESQFDLTVAAAVTPFEKFELVVQKAVELGVQRLVPLITRHTEIPQKAAQKRQSKWEKIALEAAKQCGRAKLMRVLEPTSFDDVSFGDKNVLLFSERGGGSLPDSLDSAAGTVAIFGPKGGWDDGELRHAISLGWKVVTFGGRILKAETAGIAITAILQHRFGDLK